MKTNTLPTVQKECTASGIKKKWKSFRQWQQQPFIYEIADDTMHHCANCDHDFTGNFCPYCGQKNSQGPVTWHSLWQEFLNVWGMGGRPLLYSLWQLLWRPGYFVSDYINGRRQVSFPPVKMMFLVGLFYLLMQNFVLPPVEKPVKNHSTDPSLTQPLYDFIEWMDIHHDWGMLAVSVLLILPTWLVFRNSPRNTRHTIPQGFFIQILHSSMSMLLSMVSDYLPPFFIVNIIWSIVAYKQLFGYGWWGTVWRYGMNLLSSMCIFVTLLSIYNAGIGLLNSNIHMVGKNVAVLLVFGLCMMYTLLTVYFFNNHLWQKYGRWGITWRIIATLFVPLTLFYIIVLFID